MGNAAPFDPPRILLNQGPEEFHDFAKALAASLVPEHHMDIHGIPIYSTPIVPTGEAWLCDGHTVTRFQFTPTPEPGP